MHEVDEDRSPDIAADHSDVFVSADIVGQRVQVTAVGSKVVHVVCVEIAVAEAAQIGHDHFVSGSDERHDVAPPNPFGLGIPVHEQQRVPTDAFAHVGERESVADLAAVNGERVRGRCGRLGRT